MKRVLIFSSLGVVGLAGGSAAVWQSVDRVLRANASVGEVPVGRMKREEAARKLREWWLTHKTDPITVTFQGKPLVKTTASALGITLDDAATMAQVPEDGGITQAIGGGQDASATTYPLVYARSGTPDLKALSATFAKKLPAPAPARVRFVGGKIQKVSEAARKELDASQLVDDAAAALQEGKNTVEAPLKEGGKKVTDEMLAEITDVVAQFSTHFSSGNRPRSANIRLAAKKIDGILLLPGEVFSYNDTVGRRTLKAGFKLAGVYKNGQHDTGVGGGICQVSTTLYNASLFANLGIVQRQNHSLPVPYVPLGRDATVDYGNIDLRIKNTYPTPIVLSSTYVPGKLTFRILGKKQPGLSVSIVSDGIKRGVAISAYTSRLVKQDGKIIKRESLGQSYYYGMILKARAEEAERRRRARERAAARPKPAAPAPALEPVPEPTEPDPVVPEPAANNER